jgi:hypothetical protein
METNLDAITVNWAGVDDGLAYCANRRSMEKLWDSEWYPEGRGDLAWGDWVREKEGN